MSELPCLTLQCYEQFHGCMRFHLETFKRWKYLILLEKPELNNWIFKFFDFKCKRIGYI